MYISFSFTLSHVPFHTLHELFAFVLHNPLVIIYSLSDCAISNVKDVTFFQYEIFHLGTMLAVIFFFFYSRIAPHACQQRVGNRAREFDS